MPIDLQYLTDSTTEPDIVQLYIYILIYPDLVC